MGKEDNTTTRKRITIEPKNFLYHIYDKKKIIYTTFIVEG